MAYCIAQFSWDKVHNTPLRVWSKLIIKNSQPEMHSTFEFKSQSFAITVVCCLKCQNVRVCSPLAVRRASRHKLSKQFDFDMDGGNFQELSKGVIPLNIACRLPQTNHILHSPPQSTPQPTFNLSVSFQGYTFPTVHLSTKSTSTAAKLQWGLFRQTCRTLYNSEFYICCR